MYFIFMYFRIIHFLAKENIVTVTDLIQSTHQMCIEHSWPPFFCGVCHSGVKCDPPYFSSVAFVSCLCVGSKLPPRIVEGKVGKTVLPLQCAWEQKLRTSYASFSSFLCVCKMCSPEVTQKDRRELLCTD